jgi:hypothetical protein
MGGNGSLTRGAHLAFEDLSAFVLAFPAVLVFFGFV